jgi:hypothetical protein
MLHPSLRLLLAATLTVPALGAAAFGQNGSGGDPTTDPATDPTWTDPIPPPPPSYDWRLSVTGAFQSGADEFDMIAVVGALSWQTKLSNELSLSLSGSYEYLDYDFDTDSKLALGAGDAWDDIHILTTVARLDWRYQEDWALFGGPIVQVAREAGIDLDELDTTTIGGAFVGLTNRVHNDLTLGFGLGVIDQLQAKVRWFPVLMLNWELTDNLRLQTRTSQPGSPGIELVYGLGRHSEFSFGGGYRFRRFRLDNSGVAPEGVGEDKAFLMWFGYEYKPTNRIQLAARVGVALGGELELEDARGAKNDEDYDPAGFISLTASFRF